MDYVFLLIVLFALSPSILDDETNFRCCCKNFSYLDKELLEGDDENV